MMKMFSSVLYAKIMQFIIFAYNSILRYLYYLVKLTLYLIMKKKYFFVYKITQNIM